jgi:hypothetical protein
VWDVDDDSESGDSSLDSGDKIIIGRRRLAESEPEVEAKSESDDEDHAESEGEGNTKDSDSDGSSDWESEPPRTQQHPYLPPRSSKSDSKRNSFVDSFQMLS